MSVLPVRLEGFSGKSQTIAMYIVIIIYLFILTANVFLPGGSGTTIRYNAQITHHTQTKHSTQNYTNNKGHTTHNEYNENTLTTTTNTWRTVT
jgi:hypothetical protein